MYLLNFVLIENIISLIKKSLIIRELQLENNAKVRTILTEEVVRINSTTIYYCFKSYKVRLIIIV